ncbi:MAG TPA: helix-turn-helix domain-containing protein [Candidatus Mediterraneibacter intestinavium]|nr:helix-turn-helix domain-containing protein [Candidatus Mediterraneibacter intestinavium]
MKYTDFGRRIREERRKLGLTQEKLAEDVNLSTAYIGQIERGERSPTLENIITIANRL